MPSTTPSLEKLETELVSLRELVAIAPKEGRDVLTIDRRLDEIDATLVDWLRRKDAGDNA